jgi:hypothetical protein
VDEQNSFDNIKLLSRRLLYSEECVENNIQNNGIRQDEDSEQNGTM